MLILKVCRNNIESKKKRFFNRKSNNPIKAVERKNIKLTNAVFTYVTAYDNLCDQADMTRLFNRFKGQILFCDKYVLDEKLSAFGFDYKPYFKRAVISALINNITLNGNRNVSLCVCTDRFDFNREITELAKSIKQLTLVTDESVCTQEFSDYCYYNYGAVINIIDKTDERIYDMYIDLDEIDECGKAILKIQNKDMLLYPDVSYFTGNKDVEILVSLGVPLKIACAALEVKKNIPVTWLR